MSHIVQRKLSHKIHNVLHQKLYILWLFERNEKYDKLAFFVKFAKIGKLTREARICTKQSFVQILTFLKLSF